MSCCLPAPSNYLTQSWRIINEAIVVILQWEVKLITDILFIKYIWQGRLRIMQAIMQAILHRQNNDTMTVV